MLLISCGDKSPTGSDPQTNGPNAHGEAQSAVNKKKKSTPVEVRLPDKGLAASFYVTTATIEPSSDAKINARTSGVVKKILHEEGSDVSAGDVLLNLDDNDQQLRLNQAIQNLSSASREYTRLNKMKKAGVVSPTDWETAENTFKNAEINKELAELALSYTRVSAPFDGRVVWREVDLGEHVAQGDLLFRMMSIRPLLVRIHVPANRLGIIEVGQQVTLNVDSHAKPLVTQVELVSPIVDPTTGTIKVTLRIDHYPPSVRPGDFAQVQIVTDKHENAILVESVSIIEERGQAYLYVVEDGKAIRKSVQTGFVMGGKTEIVSGISMTDKVVSKGQRKLNDQTRVEILSPNNKNIAKVKSKRGQS